MTKILLVVDVQQGFLNEYTRHIPARVARLIAQNEHNPVYFTRFVNVEGGPFRRLLDWHDSTEPPSTELAPEIEPLATESAIFSKPGVAGLPDTLAEVLIARQATEVRLVGIDTDMCVLKVAMDLFDLNIRPIIYTDCCASTGGLQSHLAGLAVLARNIGAQNLWDAGLGEHRLAAP